MKNKLIKFIRASCHAIALGVVAKLVLWPILLGCLLYRTPVATSLWTALVGLINWCGLMGLSTVGCVLIALWAVYIVSITLGPRSKTVEAPAPKEKVDVQFAREARSFARDEHVNELVREVTSEVSEQTRLNKIASAIAGLEVGGVIEALSLYADLLQRVQDAHNERVALRLPLHEPWLIEPDHPMTAARLLDSVALKPVDETVPHQTGVTSPTGPGWLMLEEDWELVQWLMRHSGTAPDVGRTVRAALQCYKAALHTRAAEATRELYADPTETIPSNERTPTA